MTEFIQLVCKFLLISKLCITREDEACVYAQRERAHMVGKPLIRVFILLEPSVFMWLKNS